MKFEDLRVEQLKKELSKIELPTAIDKIKLQRRLMEEFKRRGINIGTYDFKKKEEFELNVCSGSNCMESNLMLAAIMAQFQKMQLHLLEC